MENIQISTIFDLIIIFIVVIYAFIGLKKGFIDCAYDLISFFMTLLLTSLATPYCSRMIKFYEIEGPFNFIGNAINNIIISIILFITIRILLSLLGNVFKPIFKKIIDFIPFGQSFNRIAGIILNTIKAILYIYLFITFIGYPMLGSSEMIQNSKVASIIKNNQEMRVFIENIDELNQGVITNQVNDYIVIFMLDLYHEQVIDEQQFLVAIDEVVSQLEKNQSYITVTKEQYDQLEKLIDPNHLERFKYE